MKAEKYYSFFSAVLDFILVNFCMILGTLLGLIVFGIGPSLIAGHEISRKYHFYGDCGNRVVRDFFRIYKRNFIAGNRLCLPILIFFICLLGDQYIFSNSIFAHNLWLLLFMCVSQLLGLLYLCAVIPLTLYYQVTKGTVLKKTFEFLICNPLVCVLTILWWTLCLTICRCFPVFYLLISGLWVFGNGGLYTRAFIKNDQLINKI